MQYKGTALMGRLSRCHPKWPRRTGDRKMWWDADWPLQGLDSCGSKAHGKAVVITQLRFLENQAFPYILKE